MIKRSAFYTAKMYLFDAVTRDLPLGLVAVRRRHRLVCPMLSYQLDKSISYITMQYPAYIASVRPR